MSFSPRRQPLMTRPSYARELWTAGTLPVAVAAIEGGVVGVLAQKAFGVSGLSFATIMAAPMFANITSFVWGRLARGRRKVPFVVACMIGLLVCVGAIALLPTPAKDQKPALWVEASLVGLILLGRCMIAGVTTIRSVVWRNNYGRRYRGRVTGKIILVAALIVALSPMAAYAILDTNPQLFRVVYPVCAGIGLIGVIAFAGIRLRREHELIHHELAAPEANDTGDAPAVSGNFVSVLRDDRDFREYMIYQFIAGIGNMVCETAFIAMVIALTPEDEYLTAVLLNVTVVMGVATLTLPLWGRYLDRVHIAQYRTRHGVTWILAMFGYFGIGLGIVLGGWSIWWMLLPRVVHGIGRGGGMIAWQLGHNDFADRRLVAVYMGIHVTLTGVRGAVGPYLAVVLFFGWDAGPVFGWFGGPSVPGFAGIGVWLYLVTAVMCVVAWLGFVRMHRRLLRRESRAVAD